MFHEKFLLVLIWLEGYLFCLLYLTKVAQLNIGCFSDIVTGMVLLFSLFTSVQLFAESIKFSCPTSEELPKLKQSFSGMSENKDGVLFSDSSRNLPIKDGNWQFTAMQFKLSKDNKVHDLYCRYWNEKGELKELRFFNLVRWNKQDTFAGGATVTVNPSDIQDDERADSSTFSTADVYLILRNVELTATR